MKRAYLLAVIGCLVLAAQMGRAPPAVEGRGHADKIDPDPQHVSSEQPASGRANRFPQPGEWGCYRRDGSQQGRAMLHGSICRPRVTWRHFIGVVETLVEVRPGDGGTIVTVPTNDKRNARAILDDPRWGLRSPLVLSGGRRKPAHCTDNSTHADVLPDVPGLEKVEFESGFRASGGDGHWPASRGWLKAWKDEQWQDIWSMPPMPKLFVANPIVGDFDADGAPEVAFLPWCDLVILDARTGKLEHRCPFTKGRSYGFFGVYDMDGNGTMEFLVMADFSKHVDVLGYRDGKLRVLWQVDIELDISNPQKTMQVSVDPAADVDGDGRLEVMLNVLNGKGDGRWYVTVFDGMTGTTKAEIPDARLQGIADVDGDGAADLLTTTPHQGMIQEYGTLRVFSLNGGKPSTIWQRENAAWQLWERPMPRHVNTGATDGRRDVLWRQAGKLPVFVLRRSVKGKAGIATISVESWQDGALRPRIVVTGPNIEGLALDSKGCLLVRCRTAPGRNVSLTASPGRAKVLGSTETGVTLSTPAVVRDARHKSPVIVVAGHGEEIVAFHSPQGNQPAKELLRIRGRPQGEKWNAAVHRGPVTADLRGDGSRQILYATAAPAGHGRLVVMDLDGKEIWHHDIRRVPGGPPAWNLGGLILWQVGYFTDTHRMDVLLTFRRSMMHSEETRLLSGRDGRQIWHRDRQGHRGVGGKPFAIADCDGDGLDDAVMLYLDVYYALKGTTGQNLWKRRTRYWGRPVAGDFLNNGTTHVFFGTSSGTGLLTVNGAKDVWWDAVDSSPRSLAAFGDFTGSERMEAVGIGYPDGIRCYDTATGRINWRMPIPVAGKVTDTTASGDIDGDDRDEALFVIGRTLYCLGSDGKRGDVEWKCDLPVPTGAPVIADADNDGLAEVLVVGRDGYVFCVDGLSRDAQGVRAGFVRKNSDR